MTTDVTLTVTACQPLTCTGFGYVCGSLDNGCGTTQDCGTCPSGESCTAGACYKCAERTCPVPEFFNLSTCKCEACPCGTLHVNGHYLCNVCRPDGVIRRGDRHSAWIAVVRSTAAVRADAPGGETMKIKTTIKAGSGGCAGTDCNHGVTQKGREG